MLRRNDKRSNESHRRSGPRFSFASFFFYDFVSSMAAVRSRKHDRALPREHDPLPIDDLKRSPDASIHCVQFALPNRRVTFVNRTSTRPTVVQSAISPPSSFLPRPSQRWNSLGSEIFTCYCTTTRRRGIVSVSRIDFEMAEDRVPRRNDTI